MTKLLKAKPRQSIGSATLGRIEEIKRGIKSGEIHSVGMVAVKRNGDTLYGFEAAVHPRLIGGLELLKLSVLDEWKKGD